MQPILLETCLLMVIQLPTAADRQLRLLPLLLDLMLPLTAQIYQLTTVFQKFGVLGYTNGGTSTFGAGVLGIGGSTNAINAGLIGLADDGAAGTNFALFAEADNASDYAGYFNGNVFISGTLSASGTKNFEIDHPLDPANKILRHAAMESNEVLDQYSGNITTDGSGYATVQLPAYFESITKDFRYQLTVIGTFAQAIVKQKVSGNQFVIQTNQPNVEVSWQVTGVRNDKQMQAHPFVSEEAKTARQAGKYFQPELYGQPASAGIVYMPKSTGKTTAARRPLPSLKAVAGATNTYTCGSYTSCFLKRQCRFSRQQRLEETGSKQECNACLSSK